MMLLPKQIIGFRHLMRAGYSAKEIKAMSSALRLFPTPFKGIYYVPMEDERKAVFIEKPLMALTQALELFLGSRDFYYSCDTAAHKAGMRWQPSAIVHIVNAKLSKRINLAKRMARNEKRGTRRARKIAEILSAYGEEIIFHKIADVKNAKTTATPYGKFALPSQIRKDRMRFHKKKDGL